MTSDSPAPFWRTAARLLPFLRPHLSWLVVASVTAVLQAVLLVASPYVIKHLTDSALAADRVTFVAFLYLAMALAVVGMLSVLTRSYSQTVYVTRSVRDLRNRLTDRIQRLPVSSMEKRHTGDTVSRINGDVDACNGVMAGIPDLFYQPALCVGGLAYMLTLSWKLLLAGSILIPFASYAHLRLSRPLDGLSRRLREQLAESTVGTQDAIDGSVTVKAYGLQESLAEKYGEVIDGVRDSALRIGRVNAVLLVVYFIQRFIPQLVLPVYGGYLIVTGDLSAGGLLAAISLLWLIFTPFEELQGYVQLLRQAAPAAARLFEILDEPEERHTGEAFQLEKEVPPVSFRGVSFGYDSHSEVLSGLSFDVRQGAVVALVGASGSGKSTILKLLCGFHRPVSGRIEVYGNEIGEADIAAVRGHMALMTQDTYLFPGSVGDNIACGRPDASKEDVVAAARSAKAHDFIGELPHGHDTPVGELGELLSGGQRQRLALARTILKGAPILLLDEPTAALDAHSEALIESSLTGFLRGRTTLVIAHRLTTIRNADRILVLDGGAIVEEGRHANLVAADTLYRRLYLKQEEAARSVAAGEDA